MPFFGGPPDIAKLQAKWDVPGLVKALGYQKDTPVRQSAAMALGEIGDRTAVAPLVASLADQDRLVREAAARALGAIGDARAVGPLVAALGDGWVRSTAVASLGQIGDPAAVEPVIAMLGDSYRFVRLAAVRSLDQFRDPRAVEPLMALLGREASGRESRAASAGALAPIAALVAIGPPSVAPLLAALDDESSSVRRVAAEALGQLGDARAVGPLIAALEDRNSMVRGAAAEALDRLAWHPDGAEVAVAYWLAKGEWQECVEIGADAVEPLAATLGNRDYWVREAAARAIGEIGDPRGVMPLVGRLSDQAEHLWVREVAAEALGEIGDPAAVEPLLAVLVWASGERDSEGFLRNEDKALHAAVARALGRIGTPAVAPFKAAFAGWDRGQPGGPWTPSTSSAGSPRRPRSAPSTGRPGASGASAPRSAAPPSRPSSRTSDPAT